ncbi:hypothetical protein GGX14DRAFT_463926 [Mycena pura]|uniref:Uncharacterized protein n=1 Tax=Mycena pura TaxID=153505 RepID=A0AAD6V7Z0_9AGAR|nr:hypothetical protein GGX14DRAFT_463926 [Mycena pura]
MPKTDKKAGSNLGSSHFRGTDTMSFSACDSPLRSSILIWLFSLIPANIFHYMTLGAAAGSLVLFAAHRQMPSLRHHRLNSAIKNTAEVLTRAKTECPRDHLTLAEEETKLAQARLSASKVHSQLLEARDACWTSYFQLIWKISQGLRDCEKQARKVETATLLIMEAENQRKLTEIISETREVINAVIVRSPRNDKRWYRPESDSSVLGHCS